MTLPGWVLVASLGVQEALPRGAENERAPARAGIIGVRATDLDGHVRRLGLGKALAPVALVFIDTACPISNRYAPRLNELFHLAADERVEFFGVISDPAVSSRDARKYRQDFHLEFPVLFDASGDLASRLTPTHVPEAFVVQR